MLKRVTRTLVVFTWLALALAGIASADVVEDLVFEPMEAETADGAELPDIENPVENTLMPTSKIGLQHHISGTGAIGPALLMSSMRPVPIAQEILPRVSPQRWRPPTLSSALLSPLRI
jgi:hypothetical protein